MAKPKYQFPEDPYWKFKSDLARELTTKHPNTYLSNLPVMLF